MIAASLLTSMIALASPEADGKSAKSWPPGLAHVCHEAIDGTPISQHTFDIRRASGVVALRGGGECIFSIAPWSNEYPKQEYIAHCPSRGGTKHLEYFGKVTKDRKEVFVFGQWVRFWIGDDVGYECFPDESEAG